MGDKIANLKVAIDRLSGICEIRRVSSFYKSSPVEDLAQDWFVNLCLSGVTLLEPRELLAAFKRIEKDMGSVKERPKGPRLIDIDLIFYGKRLVNEEPLRIPHPSYRKRLFVLHPLLEIEPEALDPESGLFVKDYVSKIPAGQDLEKLVI